MTTQTLQQNTYTDGTEQANPPQAAQSAPAPANQKRELSRSERAYKWVVDIGMYFGANSGLGVIGTYIFKHKFSAQWEKSAEVLGSAIKKVVPAWKNRSNIAVGELGLGLTVLSWSGWALLYPLKKFEANKLNTLKWFDKKIDAQSPPSEKELALREKAYEEAADKAKLSWPKVIASRILGWGLFTACGMYAANFVNSQVFNKIGVTKLPKIEDYFEKWVTAITSKVYKTNDAKALGAKTGHIIGVLIILEAVSTALSSFGVRTWLNWFEKREHKKREQAAREAAPVDGLSGRNDAAAALQNSRTQQTDVQTPEGNVEVKTNHAERVGKRSAPDLSSNAGKRTRPETFVNYQQRAEQTANGVTQFAAP